jgi:hypothetical protein
MLLTQYIPLLFQVGKAVRDCNWTGKVEGTGGNVKNALLDCLLLLRRCKSHKGVELYKDRIIVALLTWTPFHQQLPQAGHCEECGEALLSRFACRCKKDVTLQEFTEMDDVYRTLQPAGEAPTNRCRDVGEKLKDDVRQALLDSVVKMLDGTFPRYPTHSVISPQRHMHGARSTRSFTPLTCAS